MKFSTALIASLGLLAKADDGAAAAPDAAAPDAAQDDAAADETCPSACWQYNAATQSCELQPGCTTITCGATDMTFTFTDNILGDGKGAEVQTVGGSNKKGTAEGDGFTMTCDYNNLDDCGLGMTVFSNGDDDDSDDKLIFEVSLTLEGNAGPDADEDALPDIPLYDQDGNAVTIQRAVNGIGITFRCNYAMTTNVSSREFQVEAVSIEGVQEQTGDLADSFELVLNGGSGETIILGDALPVEAKWLLTLEGLHFNLFNCQVMHDTQDVSLIKEGCYANALGVTYINIHEFSFKTFAVENVDTTAQTIQCTLKICEADPADATRCDKQMIKEADCDDAALEAAYDFKNVGEQVED